MDLSSKPAYMADNTWELVQFITKPFRTSDPETSRDAGHSLVRSSRKNVLQAIAYQAADDLARLHGDASAREISEEGAARHPEHDRESIRKRVGELVRDGLLIVAGTRACRFTHCNVRVFTTNPRS